MPARFQLDADEFNRLRTPVRRAGYEMDVDGATTRFRAALDPLGLPLLDLLPAFRQAPEPSTIFFDSTVHLTPRGHAIAADVMLSFLDARGLTP